MNKRKRKKSIKLTAAFIATKRTRTFEKMNKISHKVFLQHIEKNKEQIEKKFAE